MKEGERQHENKDHDETSYVDGIGPWQWCLCNSLARPDMVDQQGSLSVYLDERESVHPQFFTGFIKQISQHCGNETRHVLRSCYSAGIVWTDQVGNLGRGEFTP